MSTKLSILEWSCVINKQVEQLHKIGLEAPQGRELIYELQKMGIDIPSDALFEEECVDAILSYIKRDIDSK